MNAQQPNNNEDGFSSESDRLQEEEIDISRPVTTVHDQEVSEVKEKLPPPQQIREQSYSLQPDIQTGWSSKIDLPNPIPIISTNYDLDQFIIRTTKQNIKKAKLVYLGARYPTTYEAWHGKQFASPYSHIPVPFKIKNTNRPFCGYKRDNEDCLIFDSEIESGNLDAAYRIGPRQYELFLRIDSNTRGHIQWYNFKVRNLKKNQKYTFSICNFQKRSSLYNRGAKPYIFSQKKQENQGIGWQQNGSNIRYDERVPKVSKYYKDDLDSMFMLRFQYETNYNEDNIQIAYSVPYTFTQLSQFLHRLLQTQKRPYLKITKLSNTLSGLEVPLLIINETEEKKRDKLQSMFTKCVIVSGRAHPGESNGSYMMEGFIKFLCGHSRIAQNLRRKIIFKIIPMLNPDGVILGNYRTGLSGKDFNREFLSPDQKIFPEVYAIKKLVTENKDLYKENLLMFLDFHGHSVKKNVFMYGPQFPLIHRNYYDCRVFPKLLSDHTKMFRFYSCMFKVSEFKEATARAVLLRKLNIPFSYTIQASNGSYYDANLLKDVPFNEGSWEHMGEKIAETIEDYVQIILKSDRLRYEKIQSKKNHKKILQNKRSTFQYSNQNKLQPFRYDLQSSQLDKSLSMEHESVLNLFAEIEKMEKKRKEENENVSDGQISEGSSDQEGCQHDLQENKLQFLYQLIRRKKGKNYDPQQFNRLLEQKKQFHGKDRFLRKNKSKNQGSAVIQLFKSPDQKQLMSKSKINERKSIVFRQKVQKKEQLIEPKSKIHAPKVVSFGTGYIGFDSTPQSYDQQKLEKINIDIISQSIQSKAQAGFLPNKILDSDKMRQTYVISKKHRSYDLGQTYMRENSLNKVRITKPKVVDSFRLKMLI